MEDSILKLFLYDKHLKFSEIEKKLSSRSNKISYHLTNMVKEGKLIKENELYSLSENNQKLIPYLTDKNSVLAILLIAIEKDNKFFLIKRNKRPFKNDKWCMPGGRLIVGETISQATKRIMLEKHNLKCKYKKVNSVSLEHVKDNKKVIHSFMLIFVSAVTKDKLDYKKIDKLKNKMVESDHYLLTKDINLEIKISNLHSKA